MNPTERAAHPSTAQIQGLLDFLEKNPSLAKGFSRVPSARETARKCWEKLALQLNSLGGCVKTWKQWTKYWADKKSAVKKKGALRFKNRNKTGGGKEVVEVELSEFEERILTLMGGESFSTGDRHLEINPFFEAQVGEGSEDSPSLLASFQLIGHNPVPSLPMEQQSTPSYIEDLPPENVPVVEASPHYVTERQAIVCLPGTSGPSSRPSDVRMASPHYVTERQAIVCLPGTSGPSSRPSDVRMASPHYVTERQAIVCLPGTSGPSSRPSDVRMATPQYVTERQAIVCLPGTSGPSSRPSDVRMVNLSPLPMVPSPPCTPPTVGVPASPPAPPTPSGSGSHPQNQRRNARRQLIGSPEQNLPLPNTTTSRRHSRRGRVGRPSPPSQRRSRFISFSERFLAIEEQKLEINRRNSKLFEMLVNQLSEILKK